MIAATRTVGPRKLHVRQGSPEWLEARRTHITACPLAGICRLPEHFHDGYRCPLGQICRLPRHDHAVRLCD
jgi:hypothetical protein